MHDVACEFACAVKAWPNARNISTQHLATLLHDVATAIERACQTHATFQRNMSLFMCPRPLAHSDVDKNQYGGLLSGIDIGVVELQLFHWGYFLRMMKERAKEGKLVSGSREDRRRVSSLILCKN